MITTCTMCTNQHQSDNITVWILTESKHCTEIKTHCSQAVVTSPTHHRFISPTVCCWGNRSAAHHMLWHKWVDGWCTESQLGRFPQKCPHYARMGCRAVGGDIVLHAPKWKMCQENCVSRCWWPLQIEQILEWWTCVVCTPVHRWRHMSRSSSQF